MAVVNIADPKASAGSRGYVGTVDASPGVAPVDASKSTSGLRVARPGQSLIAPITTSGGAAYDSGILDASMFENLTIRVNNLSAVTTRTVTITFYSEADVAVHIITRVVPVSTAERYVIGSGRDGAGVIDTVVIASPVDVAPKMRVQVAAAGADSVTVNAWGH